jgi:hypothetical protein
VDTRFGGKMKNQKLLKELKAKVQKYAGPKCSDFNYGCFCCQAWMAYSIIEDMFIGEE